MNGVIFRLLTRGPGLWLDVGGRGHRAGTPKEQCLLAILLLSPNQPVSVGQISERVWGGRPPHKSHSTIEKYVGNIRRRLRQLFDDRVRIRGKQGTYTLEVDPETIDVFRFHRLRDEAMVAARQGELERAIALYREAESLCGAEPLSGLEGSWAQRMGQDLADTLFRVRRERIGLELRLGRYADALDELPAMARAKPDDQVLVGHLMTALAHTGRRADALAVYRRTRAYLTENLGIEPDRKLFELHQRILDGRELPKGEPPEGEFPAQARSVRTPEERRDAPAPNELPADIPHFVGRERELELIARVRADRRGGGLVVIEGMPGVGKTALAVHAAHRVAARYPDARLYLDLRTHDAERPALDARTALGELLTRLGVPRREIPDTLDERAALWRGRVAGLRALVVLDDADGLEQVLPLLPGRLDRWGGLILVTTRTRTELIPEMRRIPLNVLPADEAARLWSRLTGDHAEHDRAERGAARRLRRRCAGLPLAIVELARRGTADEGLPRRPPRVDEAVLRSYRRLTPDQRRAFRRLGLFPGGDFPLDVVRVLTESSPEVALGHVEALLRCHLIDEGASGRFRFHRLVRSVAYDLARRDDPARDIRRAEGRLLRHYLQAADAADRALFPHRWRTLTPPAPDGHEPPALAAARDWFDAEWRTVLDLARYAAEHEWKSHCARLMHLLAEYLDFRGCYTDAAQGHALAVRACRDTGDQMGVARAALDLAFARYRTAYYTEAVYQAKEARRIYEARGRRREQARCLELHGLACWEQDERREALALWEEAAEHYREAGDRKGIADILRHKAMARWSMGWYAESGRLCDEALRIYREIGDRVGEMKTLNNKGHVAQSTARHREADLLYRQASAICKETTGRDNHAILDHNQGDLHKYKKRYETALECYARALAAYRKADNRRNQADVLNGIGEAYLELQRIEHALDHFHQAKRLAADIGCHSEEARALAGLAAVHREMDRYDHAMGLYEAALSMARSIGDPRLEAFIVDGVAHTQWDRGRHELARVRWRQARRLFADIGLHEFAKEIEIKLETLGGLPPDPD